MNEYDKIRELSNKTFYYMGNYSQLTIDLVQKAEQLFTIKDKVRSEEFGSLLYDVDNVLEVVNPLLLHDIEVLKELSKLLESKY